MGGHDYTSVEALGVWTFCGGVYGKICAVYHSKSQRAKTVWKAAFMGKVYYENYKEDIIFYIWYAYSVSWFRAGMRF